VRLLILFLLLCIGSGVSAQVKVDAKATGRHAKAINQAKGAKQTAKERREQAKKLQEQVKARKLYNQRYDSLSKVYGNDSLRSEKIDSLRSRKLTKKDSLSLSRTILESSDFPPEYRELILNPIVIDSVINTTDADSLALAKATAILEEDARKFLPEEMGDTENPLDQFANPAQGMTIPSKPNPNLVKPDRAKKLFSQIDPEQFQEAQADIQKLKNKYSEIPDTRYPKEGTKRNSLEDIPFAKRLYFGGNISLQSTDPLILSTNLQLGYWINRKWLGGVGITLREQFTAEDSAATVSGDGHGYSLFTRYNIPKGFFVWAESEWQIDKSLFGGEQQEKRGWQKAYLLGIGREFKIGFVQMMSMVMYDFNYQNNDINARPLVFRLGVRFSKNPG
jgi:hypothetical protein